jgi:hypothetical protein
VEGKFCELRLLGILGSSGVGVLESPQPLVTL